jgi:hypothetical protein
MPDLTSNSQIFNPSASAQTANFADYFNEIIVENADTIAVSVNTDGSVVTAYEAGAVVVLPGSTVSIANEQVKSYPFKVGAGGDPFNIGGTAQQNTPASGHGTSVSFISETTPGSGKIIVSAQ